MGYFAYIPKMACNHGVISMNHRVNGQIQFNDQQFIFDQDWGYIEKDWGTSFPDRYIWIQANHFNQTDLSVMCSIATIPMMKTQFIGHICNLTIADEEYRFATYNGTKIIKAEVSEQQVAIQLQRKQTSLFINAIRSEAGELKAPNKGQMSTLIKEGLGGSVSFRLVESGQTIATGTSDYAGIEVVNF